MPLVPSYPVAPPYQFPVDVLFTPAPNSWYDVAFEGFILVEGGVNPGADDKLQFFLSFGPNALGEAQFQLNPGQQSSGFETLGPLKDGDSPNFSWSGRVFSGAVPTIAVLSVILYEGGPITAQYGMTIVSFTALKVA